MIGAERNQPGITVVEFVGPRLDAARADVLRAGLRRVIDRGARRIVPDFGRPEAIDSTGLGVLVGCLGYMGEGGAIEIASPGGRVLKLLTPTRTDRVSPVRVRA